MNWAPGAVEAGVGDYIDRCLADYLAAEKPLFLEGLSNLDVYSLRTQKIAFATLPADQRDAVLTDIDNNQAPNLRGFFNRVRRLTLEGMFGDPVPTAATKTSPAGTSSTLPRSRPSCRPPKTKA